LSNVDGTFNSVALPIGQLLLSSFFKFFGFYEADMLTLEHYRNVWENSSFWRAFGNTMLLGVVGATATMALQTARPAAKTSKEFAPGLLGYFSF
jgi:ABC-type spermidine/putrescine transport system permease subunit II